MQTHSSLSGAVLADMHSGVPNNALHTSLTRIAFAAHGIEVWQTCLDPGPEQFLQCEKLLSDDELLRARRFQQERHRRRFVVARGMLRVLLAGHLGVEANAIRFVYEKKGKPALAVQPKPFQFNVSHAHELALFALSPQRQVGVDIEYLQRDIPYEDLARRFFSPREVAALEHFPPAERQQEFLTAWTRKEAIAKIGGEGLSAVVNKQVEVPLGPLHAPHRTPHWNLYALEVENDYVAHLAVE